MNKSEIRTLFPHSVKGHIYLNHAAISPMSDRVKHAIERFLADRNHGNIDNFPEWMDLTEKTRELISNLINASTSDRITFLGNTPMLCQLLLKG